MVDSLFEIKNSRTKGDLDTKGGIILYPNILIVSNCNGFYVAELMGAKRDFEKLTVIRHKEKSIYRYLNQFDSSEPDPCLHMDGKQHGFRFLRLSQSAEAEALSIRFPQLKLFSSGINRVGGHGSVFSFGDNFEYCAVENSILVNSSENVFRCKNILSAYIASNKIDKKSVDEMFQWTTSNGEVKGVHTVHGNDENLVISAQLQAMYLFPSLHETTLGNFINSHPEIVRHAFQTDLFIYEPYLEWIEHDGTCEDKAINPDLLIKRSDGNFDIYDLKTALLDKNNITKGGRRRRRFIDYVEEGISQLANYREYFSYIENAKHAEKKYGIKIDNPKLVLITGSYDNVNIEEINQACRKYDGMFDIIDYDTFCHLFISNSQL